MSSKTVAVIFGGCSPEYEVSIKSAYSIISAIDRSKYHVILIGITRTGEWYKYNGAVDDIPTDKWHLDERYLELAVISPSIGGQLLVFRPDNIYPENLSVVFPVLHGKNGEDGTIQGLCELAGIPVVGSGSAASALCMDKDRSHKLVSLEGISVPKSFCIENAHPDIDFSSYANQLGYPLFVKPLRAGSSIGISKVDNETELSDAIKEALLYDDAVILEEFIDGFETGCSVVGNNELVTGRIDEIELAGGFFDYDEKYTLKTSKIHMPARISGVTEEQLQEAAKTIYRVLGCKGYARIDIFLTSKGEIVFNEANTIPGFTSHSRFPNMMKGIGVEYPELVDMLISLALE